ncbi:hypothetical protein Hanom_Chr08g00714641 [Helianthus anomalus]
MMVKLIMVYHGGEFSDYPGNECLNGKITYVDNLNTKRLKFDVLDQIMKDIEYDIDDVVYYFTKNPHVCLDFGLRHLSVDGDLAHLCDLTSKGFKVIDLYVETDHSNVMMHSLDDVDTS